MALIRETKPCRYPERPQIIRAIESTLRDGELAEVLCALHQILLELAPNYVIRGSLVTAIEQDGEVPPNSYPLLEIGLTGGPLDRAISEYFGIAGFAQPADLCDRDSIFSELQRSTFDYIFSQVLLFSAGMDVCIHITPKEDQTPEEMQQLLLEKISAQLSSKQLHIEPFVFERSFFGGITYLTLLVKSPVTWSGMINIIIKSPTVQDWGRITSRRANQDLVISASGDGYNKTGQEPSDQIIAIESAQVSRAQAIHHTARAIRSAIMFPPHSEEYLDCDSFRKMLEKTHSSPIAIGENIGTIANLLPAYIKSPQMTSLLIMQTGLVMHLPNWYRTIDLSENPSIQPLLESGQVIDRDMIDWYRSEYESIMPDSESGLAINSFEELVQLIIKLSPWTIDQMTDPNIKLIKTLIKRFPIQN